MEKTNEALNQYKSTLDDVFEREKNEEWTEYHSGIENKMSRFDQKVAKNVRKDSQRLTGEKPSTKRKIGNIMAIGMLAASAYILGNNIPISQYEVKPGDGFSNVAYELNLPETRIEKLEKSYESEFGTETLHPDRTAKRYITGTRWE